MFNQTMYKLLRDSAVKTLKMNENILNSFKQTQPNVGKGSDQSKVDPTKFSPNQSVSEFCCNQKIFMC